MTHLRIEQNGITEEVSSSVISKLYEIVHAGVDASSNLQGRLHCPISYRTYITYLTTQYPDLYITVDDYAIPFEDPNMVTYLNSIGIGSNGMITEAQAAAATSIYSSTANTTVTKFNEFRYFTNITTSSSGGWNGQGTNYFCFQNWTALEEIDVSNLTMIGHSHAYGNIPNFLGCTALKTVTASSNLEKIGTSAFRDCSNLETISGLSGEISLGNKSFGNCTKLKNSNFTNVQFLLGEGDNEGEDFINCKALTSINVSPNTTVLPLSCFNGCDGLTLVTGLSNITNIKGSVFQNCSSLTSLTFGGNVTNIGGSAFDGCSYLTTVTGLQNSETVEYESFDQCSRLTSVDIDWSNVTNHTIPQSCFRGCSSLTSPGTTNTVTVLQAAAFQNCSSLTSISLAQGCNIKRQAFEYCTSLTTLNVSGNIQMGNDGGYQFDGCENLVLPNNLTITAEDGKIYRQAFQNCKQLTSITLDPSVTTLGYGCFNGCTNLETINLENITTMENLGGLHEMIQFQDCTNLFKITGIVHMPKLTYISQRAFGGCSYVKMFIAEKLEDIGSSNYPFLDTQIQAYICPKASKGNGNAFGLNGDGFHPETLIGNDNIKVIELGKITYIGKNAFKTRTNLQALVLHEQDSVITLKNYNSGDSFSYYFPNANMKVYVPDAMLSTFQADSVWSNFTSYLAPISQYNFSNHISDITLVNYYNNVFNAI